MQLRQVAVFVVVLAGVLLGAQLAFSDVGQEVGRHWSPPVELGSVPAGDERGVTDLDAGADSDTGAVGWIERDGDRWTVKVARLTVEGGEVTVERTQTVAESSSLLLDVAVAVDGERTAVVWEDKETNDVVFHLLPSGDQQVVSADPLRVEETSVAFADGVALVAWQEYDDGIFDARLATVADGRVRYATGGRPTAGENSPSISTAGDRFAVNWLDSENSTAMVTTGRVSNGTVRVERVQTYGRADPIGGFLGGLISVGSARNETAVRTVWTDMGKVTLGTATEDGRVVTSRVIGVGKRPAIAVRDDRWIAAWLVQSRSGGSDVTFRYGGPDGEQAGVVSKLPSNANDPRPFFGPSLAMAWTEHGSESRAVVSAYRPTPVSNPVSRLASSPGRFAFLAVVAAISGGVLFAFMPWSVLALLAAFALTNQRVLFRTLGGGAWVATRSGRETDRQQVARRLESVPPLAWTGLFALGETAILVALLPTAARVTSLGFSHPVETSALALAATVTLTGVVRLRSGWQGALLFVYFQTAALWTTALPTVL